MTKALTERNAAMWNKHRDEGLSNQALSKEYGITEQRVSQVLSMMARRANLPFTSKELAIHSELYDLNRQERVLIERLHKVVTRRIEVHEQLDRMVADRAQDNNHRRASDFREHQE